MIMTVTKKIRYIAPPLVINECKEPKRNLPFPFFLLLWVSWKTISYIKPITITIILEFRNITVWKRPQRYYKSNGKETTLLFCGTVFQKITVKIVSICYFQKSNTFSNFSCRFLNPKIFSPILVLIVLIY